MPSAITKNILKKNAIEGGKGAHKCQVFNTPVTNEKLTRETIMNLSNKSFLWHGRL
jgi:hypothetical protein